MFHVPLIFSHRTTVKLEQISCASIFTNWTRDAEAHTGFLSSEDTFKVEDPRRRGRSGATKPYHACHRREKGGGERMASNDPCHLPIPPVLSLQWLQMWHRLNIQLSLSYFAMSMHYKLWIIWIPLHIILLPHLLEQSPAADHSWDSPVHTSWTSWELICQSKCCE